MRFWSLWFETPFRSSHGRTEGIAKLALGDALGVGASRTKFMERLSALAYSVADELAVDRRML